MRMHPVVHVSRLRAFHEDLSAFRGRVRSPGPPAPDILAGEEHFHVEAFRAHRGSGSRLQYLVKWTGYPEHENSWVSAAGLRKDLDAATFKAMVSAYASAVKPAAAKAQRRQRRLTCLVAV
jgi:hypothetical protein